MTLINATGKVTRDEKDRLKTEADEREMTLSAYIRFVAIEERDQKAEEHIKEVADLKEKLADLKEKLADKEQMVQMLNSRLEKEQNLVGQQQELQLMAQQQIREMQKSQQLLIESKEQSISKWQFWKRKGKKNEG